jgi:RNA polymerase-binding transcription factor DksA
MGPDAGLDEAERHRLRAALVAELSRARDQAVSLTRQFDDIVAAAELSNADDEHDPEGTTIAFERSQVSALLKQVHHDLTALERTLTDLEDGERHVGSCEQCAGPIGIERLIALPAARRCVRCAG